MEQFTNYTAATTLNSSYTAGAGTISVASVVGFPTVPTFTVSILDQTTLVTKVLLRVTGVSGTTWTVAAESTDANASTGDQVVTVISAAAIAQMRADMSMSGPYASLPVSAKVGDIYTPTDSFYDKIRWNGSSWDHFRGGRLLTLPDDSLFSWDNQDASTLTTAYGGIKVFNGTGSGGSARYMASPTMPYTITMGAIPWVCSTTYSGVNIIVRDSTGKIISVGPNYHVGNQRNEVRFIKNNSITSYNSD